MRSAWLVCAFLGIGLVFSSEAASRSSAVPSKSELRGPGSLAFTVTGGCWRYGICFENRSGTVVDEKIQGGIVHYCVRIPNSVLPAQRRVRCFRPGVDDPCNRVATSFVIVCDLWVKKRRDNPDLEMLPTVVLVSVRISPLPEDFSQIPAIPACPKPRIVGVPLRSKPQKYWEYGAEPRNGFRVRCPGMR